MSHNQPRRHPVFSTTLPTAPATDGRSQQDRRLPGRAAALWPALRLPLVAALAVFLLGLPTLIMPLHPDQALFALTGRMIADGGFPYTDAWDTKQPGVYLFYTAAVQGPFATATNVRVFDLLWTALTAAVMVELGRRWWNGRAGLCAALSYGLAWFGGSPWWQGAQPDGQLVLFLLLALLLYGDGGSRPRLVLSGVCLGLAAQLRVNILLLAPFFPLVELLAVPSRGRPALWVRRMLPLGVGVLATALPVLVYLLIGGAFGAFIEAMRFAGQYTAQGGPYNTPTGPTLNGYWDAVRHGFWNWASLRPALTVPALAAAAYAVLLRRDSRLTQLAFFALLAYVSVAMQAKFFWYHYGYLLAILALIAGWGWDALLRGLARVWSRDAAANLAFTLATVLVLASPQITDTGWRYWQDFRRYLSEPTWRDQYEVEGYGRPGHHYAAVPATVRYLTERTAPDDPIYVWGYDPAVYLQSGRPPASRFIQSFGLMSTWTPPQWQAEFLRDLRARRPAYIVVERGSHGSWIVGHAIDMAEYVNREFPAFAALLTEDYIFETEIVENRIYRRLDHTPPAR